MVAEFGENVTCSVRDSPGSSAPKPRDELCGGASQQPHEESSNSSPLLSSHLSGETVISRGNSAKPKRCGNADTLRTTMGTATRSVVEHTPKSMRVGEICRLSSVTCANVGEETTTM